MLQNLGICEGTILKRISFNDLLNYGIDFSFYLEIAHGEQVEVRILLHDMSQ
jgi:hypothetical protein